MTQDVIVNTTVEFIVGSKKYLKLAFYVGRAVSRIRNKAAENVLGRVEKRLQQQFGNRDWIVELLREKRSRQPEAVRIKKESWRKELEDYNDEKWKGVRVNCGGAWGISTGPFKEVESTEIEALFCEYKIGVPKRTKLGFVHCHLEGDLEDWDGADFVFRAWHKPEKIAKDLAEKMETLAIEIDKILPG